MNRNRIMPIAIALVVLPFASDVRAHNLMECRWVWELRFVCWDWWIDTTCWFVPVRVRRCRSVDHTHKESKQERDERVMAEMTSCIAITTHNDMAGCDTPEDEEDVEPCEEDAMPTVYRFRRGLQSVGLMTAEDPITSTSGALIYPNVLGTYSKRTGMIK